MFTVDAPCPASLACTMGTSTAPPSLAGAGPGSLLSTPPPPPPLPPPPPGFPGGSDGKESACNAGDLGSITGLGRSPGEGNACPL